MAGLGAAQHLLERGVLPIALPVAEIGEEADAAFEPIEDLVDLGGTAKRLEPVSVMTPSPCGAAARLLFEPRDRKMSASREGGCFPAITRALSAPSAAAVSIQAPIRRYRARG